MLIKYQKLLTNRNCLNFLMFLHGAPAAIAMETLSVISTFVEDHKASLKKMFWEISNVHVCLQVCFSVYTF